MQAHRLKAMMFKYALDMTRGDDVESIESG
jgi:hypothetical protein